MQLPDQIAQHVEEGLLESMPIALDSSEVYLAGEQTYTFSMVFDDGMINAPLPLEGVAWEVENPAIAQVTADGTVSCRSTGTTRVFAILPGGRKLQAVVVSDMSQAPQAWGVPVLAYHRVCADFAKSRWYSDENLALSQSDFEEQLEWLEENGYTTIGTNELYAWIKKGAYLPAKSVMLTFDDGFYETYHVVYPLLKKHRMKGVAFVVGSNIPATTLGYDYWGKHNARYMGWDAIDEIRRDYPELEIQSHSYDLHYRLKNRDGIATALSRDQVAADFALNEQLDATAFAHPFGQTTEAVREVLEANPRMVLAFGYPMEYPATRQSDCYNIPRYKIFGDGTIDDFAIAAMGGARR